MAKRPNALRVSRNFITESEKITSVPPGKSLAAPKPRKAMSQWLRTKKEIDVYFQRYHPEQRMILYRRVWKASSPTMAQKAKLAMHRNWKPHAKGDQYVIMQRDCYLWVTIIPPIEEQSPEQKIAYDEWQTVKNAAGWSKYNAVKAMEARLGFGHEGNPGVPQIGGESWEEADCDCPAHGGNLGDHDLG